MARNGNPAPLFDVNKLTEFRVALLPSEKLQLITRNDDLKVGNDDLKKSKQKLVAGSAKGAGLPGFKNHEFDASLSG